MSDSAFKITSDSELEHSRPSNIGREFFVNGTLLADETGGWRNLGDWSHTDNYREAAENLASRVGEAARLCANTAVLDLACGYGASLRLWARRFGVTQCAGVELQSECVYVSQRNIALEIDPHECAQLNHVIQETAEPTALKKRASLLDYTVVQGRFDCWPLPDPISTQHFDAVVCVDAAYHAHSLEAFLRVATNSLASGRKLAFTTLVLDPVRKELPTLSTIVLAGAGISRSSLLSPAGITQALIETGFQGITIENLDQPVLRGFGRYVKRRERALSWYKRLSPDWFKIKGTGVLCDKLIENSLLHYVLVSAVKV